MTDRHWLAITAALLFLAVPARQASARGFGGFHGGGGFGGFRGGGGWGGDRGFGGDRSYGSFAGGWGGDRGSMTVNDFARSGGDRNAPTVNDFARSGGSSGGFGGFRGGDFGAAPNRGQLNSFFGLPSDEGFHSASAGDFNVSRGSVTGPRGGTAAGVAVTGPNGGEAARGAAVGPNGRVAVGEGVRGPEGYGAARGVAAGPNGAVAGFTHVTPTDRYTTGVAVRGNFHNYGAYGRGWYGAHPGAWYARGWAAGAAWQWATWPALGAWFGYTADVLPYYYDYGDNVTYSGDSVLENGQQIATAGEYYQQASALADAGSQAAAPADADWLPLGVFALARSGHDASTATVQLAVDKQGIVRGNYTDNFTNQPVTIQGSVNKQTQRLAFAVGDNKTTVFDTCLYNLTRDEVPILIHNGKSNTEQWLLIRLNQPEGQAASGN